METDFDTKKGVHDQERAQNLADDAATEEKERRNAEFNERAGTVVEAFNKLGSEKTRFESKLDEKRAELEAAQGADEVDDKRVSLLQEYVEVYEQQVGVLSDRIGEATSEFEQVTEEKRLKDE
jgi:hypothetical protein